MKIAIDIGHANHTGACGNGLEEHMMATVIAGMLAIRLKDAGHVADLLDYADQKNDADLRATIKAANNGGYDLGISIHCDSSENKEAKGAHVCYVSSKGQVLADCLAKPLSALLPGRKDVTKYRTNLGILKETKPVWVLAECGFISHPGDARMMRENPALIADALRDGIVHYDQIKT